VRLDRARVARDGPTYSGRVSRDPSDLLGGDRVTTTAPKAPAPATAITHVPRPRRSSALRRFLRRADGRLSPYAYIAPFFGLFIAFGLFPVLYTGYVSLTDRDLLSPGTAKFVGLANYRDLVVDDYFWNALKNTVVLMAMSSVPQLVLAVILAHVLNARLRGRTLFRMGVLLPNVTSIVAVTIIFGQIFGRDFGVINWGLGLVGIGPVNWQAGDWTSRSAIAVMVIWRWTGYNALIYLAAMQAIPKDHYEAAALDGAGTWRQLWHITLPALRPTIAFTALISVIGQMQLFTEPLLFDTSPGSVSGGSGRQFQTLTLFLYEQSFRLFHLGYGAAIAWVLFLITVIIAGLGYLLTRRGAWSGGDAG
jgi:cellobiose transport system permease protein